MPKNCGICNSSSNNFDVKKSETFLGVNYNFVPILQKVDEMGPIYHASSGFLAGFFSSFTLCPTELVKCRLQAMREMSTINGGNGGATIAAKPITHVIPFCLANFPSFPLY